MRRSEEARLESRLQDMVNELKVLISGIGKSRGQGEGSRTVEQIVQKEEVGVMSHEGSSTKI